MSAISGQSLSPIELARSYDVKSDKYDKAGIAAAPCMATLYGLAGVISAPILKATLVSLPTMNGGAVALASSGIVIAFPLMAFGCIYLSQYIVTELTKGRVPTSENEKISLPERTAYLQREIFDSKLRKDSLQTLSNRWNELKSSRKWNQLVTFTKAHATLAKEISKWDSEPKFKEYSTALEEIVRKVESLKEKYSGGLNRTAFKREKDPFKGLHKVDIRKELESTKKWHVYSMEQIITLERTGTMPLFSQT